MLHTRRPPPQTPAHKYRCSCPTVCCAVLVHLFCLVLLLDVAERQGQQAVGCVGC
jgi:hypothetical protein